MDGWLISRYEFTHLTGPNKLCSTVEEKVADQTVNTIERGTLKCVDSNALSYQNIDAKLLEAVSEEATLMQSNYPSEDVGKKRYSIEDVSKTDDSIEDSRKIDYSKTIVYAYMGLLNATKDMSPSPTYLIPSPTKKLITPTPFIISSITR
ncbi:Uncharacterized protein Fot_28561 [Forsythia ovata]|uniref:Uncharacterized protein n=1 Tax=Forsythia ovata TaxID=205694 RepID=A0ABD1TPC4_9LAMI